MDIFEKIKQNFAEAKTHECLARLIIQLTNEYSCLTSFAPCTTNMRGGNDYSSCEECIAERLKSTSKEPI